MPQSDNQKSAVLRPTSHHRAPLTSWAAELAQQLEGLSPQQQARARVWLCRYLLDAFYAANRESVRAMMERARHGEVGDGF